MLLECKDCQKEKNEAGENGGNKTEECKKEDENMSDELKKNKDFLFLRFFLDIL